MKTRIKVALTVFALILLGLLAHGVFILLNIASTPAFLLGCFLSLVVFVFAPPVFVKIWRRKKSNDSQTNTTA